MKIDSGRVERLQQYIGRINDNADGQTKKALYLSYQNDLLQVTPHEVFEIFYRIWHQGQKAGDILVYLDKAMNVFHQGLVRYGWTKPAAGSFLGSLRSENEALVRKLDRIRAILQMDHFLDQIEELRRLTRPLSEFNQHYLKKENILFPYMEQKLERFDGVAVMWALHDQIRRDLQEVLQYLDKLNTGRPLEADAEEGQGLAVAYGRLFFSMQGLIEKEELVLFPAVHDIFTKQEFDQMMEQSFEFGFPYLEELPLRKAVSDQRSNQQHMGIGAASAAADAESVIDRPEGCFRTDSGSLSWQQLEMVLSALPVDMTFVDENNKVCYFSKPKDRLFPRSPAVIGRDVNRCHPPESVAVVEEIVQAFREGHQDQATFWIQRHGQMVLIRYFALRDQSGRYKGVLEVSQDVTEIRSLDGERRLLEWDSKQDNRDSIDR